eukprot:6458736-Heterocapsa_arctica.AAC.1
MHLKVVATFVQSRMSSPYLPVSSDATCQEYSLTLQAVLSSVQSDLASCAVLCPVFSVQIDLASWCVSLLLEVSLTVCHCPMRDQSSDDHAYKLPLLFASVLTHLA